MAQRNRTIPADSGSDDFPDFHSDEHSIQELAAQQGVSPVVSVKDLRGDFWPADDDITEFSATIRRWRREE